MTEILHWEEGTPLADDLGFTEDLFHGWGEIIDGTIWLHYINSKIEGQGHVKDLIQAWIENQYPIVVVRPGAPMKHICEKFGFVSREEVLPRHYGQQDVNVWYCHGTVCV